MADKVCMTDHEKALRHARYLDAKENTYQAQGYSRVDEDTLNMARALLAYAEALQWLNAVVTLYDGNKHSKLALGFNMEVWRRMLEESGALASIKPTESK